MSADQPIERAGTLEDARAEVLTPQRLNSVVFGVFAAVALAIAVVGVAGVLAFSVSARTREFGIRLALGSEPQRLFKDVIAEGAAMAAAGSWQARYSDSSGAGGTQLFRGCNHARRFCDGGLCACASNGRGNRVDAARGTRRARRCNSGATHRMI
jgi:ABC-type antimicrobial peptide transport system, permease component